MIAKLLKEIEEIEEQAGGIDPEDKTSLYELLIIAYFKAKDIIVAQAEIVPKPIKVIDTDRINELEFALEQSSKALEQSQIDKISMQHTLDNVQLVLSGKAGDDSEEHN